MNITRQIGHLAFQRILSQPCIAGTVQPADEWRCLGQFVSDHLLECFLFDSQLLNKHKCMATCEHTVLEYQGHALIGAQGPVPSLIPQPHIHCCGGSDIFTCMPKMLCFTYLCQIWSKQKSDVQGRPVNRSSHSISHIQCCCSEDKGTCRWQGSSKIIYTGELVSPEWLETSF